MTEVAEVKTIGDVERIVHGSGMWDGTGPVEFSDNGLMWSEAWAPTTETVIQTPVDLGGGFSRPGGPETVVVQGHPEFARVTVYRKDVRIPTTVTIRWDEQRPRENEEWAAKWDAAPTRHFGRTARMVAFRQTFRDILGDVSIEDEERATPTAPPAPVERDWRAEFDAASTVEEIMALNEQARAVRAFSATAEGTALHIAWKDRKRAIEADWTPAKDAWAPTGAVNVDTENPTAAEPVASAPIRQPQDHLAGNRAQRRAKKRGRR